MHRHSGARRKAEPLVRHARLYHRKSGLLAASIYAEVGHARLPMHPRPGRKQDVDGRDKPGHDKLRC